MTQEQIEAKALELYPVEMEWIEYRPGFPEEEDQNAKGRAAFIKGCQYAATPSAGLQWVKASERMPKNDTTVVIRIGHIKHVAWHNNLESFLTIDEIYAPHSPQWRAIEWLDESSPAQPGYSEARPIEAAPQDGTEILGWCDLGEDGFQWRPVSWPTHSPLSQAGKEGRTGPWQYVQDNRCRYPKVTHWMPLPSSPLTKQP